MATRYVWSKYSCTSSTTTSVSTSSTVSNISLSSGVTLTFSTSISKSEGTVSPSGTTYTHSSSKSNICSLADTSNYPYCFVGTYPSTTVYKAKTFSDNDQNNIYTWHYNSYKLGICRRNMSDIEDIAVQSSCIYKQTASSKTTYSKGSTSYGYVSNSSSGKYPSNSYSGSYWYVKVGSDCIDPTNVTFPNTNPKAGETVTITATKRSNTYGGTISYRYEYSVDGGSTWTTIKTTTATSTTVTVPNGAEQFQARVRASDDMGFTSTTYVYSDNVEVSGGGIGYCGVEGAIREGVFHACVDGVIKTDFAILACVDGVIKACS